MWYQLYSSLFHYAVHLFGAVVYFAAGWLYLDAYTKKHPYLKLRIAGLFILSISSLFEGMTLPLFGLEGEGESLKSILHYIVPIIGYLCIFLSFPFDPIQKRPSYAVVSVFTTSFKNAVMSLVPVGSLSVAVMYFTHVAEGLEWHLLLPAISFSIITVAEIIHAIQSIFSSTQIAYVLDLIRPFGLFWWAEHIILLFGFIVLIRWVFWYLLKSFEMQVVFISTVSVALVTFIITTFFVYHLSNSLLLEISHQVTQSVKVFSFSIESKKREAIADARFIAADDALIQAIQKRNDTEISRILEKYTISRGIRGLLLTNAQGKILVSSDSEHIFSDANVYQAIVSQAKIGGESGEMVALPGISSHMLYMLAAVPIVSENSTIGSILLAYSLDTAVTQGIKKELGLEGGLFAGDRLSVTSMRTADAPVGMRETDAGIISRVLGEGKRFEGLVVYNTTEYLGAYEPIVNSTGNPIGMMYVGRPIADVFAILAQAIQATYFASTVLLLLSVFPALYLAKYIIYQVH